MTHHRKVGGNTWVATRKGCHIPPLASNPMVCTTSLSLSTHLLIFAANLSGAVEGTRSERVVGGSARANGVSSRRGRRTPRAMSVPQGEISSLIIISFFLIICPCFISRAACGVDANFLLRAAVYTSNIRTCWEDGCPNREAKREGEMVAPRRFMPISSASLTFVTARSFCYFVLAPFLPRLLLHWGCTNATLVYVNRETRSVWKQSPPIRLWESTRPLIWQGGPP